MATNRTVWFNAGWFPYEYGFCPNEAAWKHSLSKMTSGPVPKYPNDAATTNLFRRIDTKKPVAIVTVKTGHPPKDIVELLVHEAMHVWRDIREQLGEEKPSSELEAYAIQNIFGNLLGAFQRTRGAVLLKR